MKFYKCNHCGNVITFIESKGAPVKCCGEKMQEIIPDSVDAAAEKHVPVLKGEGQKVVVTVSSVQHPMLKEHYISFIAFASDDRLQIIKQYPEWNLAARIPVLRHGVLLWYCTKDGLFYKNI